MKMKFIVDIEKIAVKEFLALQGVSRTMLRKARVQNLIYVNGENVKNHTVVDVGDVVVLELNEKRNEEILLNHQALEVLFEDEYILIVNKPNDLASHPSRKHQLDNLISVVGHYFNQNNITSNIHIVTRLDFSTSGLVLIAKSGFMHFELSKIEITKRYLAKIVGILDEKVGSIRLPIRRIEEHDIRRWVFEDGKMGISHYRVLKEDGNDTIVEVILETGRTHQIRVHFAYLHHPVYGDQLYGATPGDLLLHCSGLEFIHPITKEKVAIENKPKWWEEEKHA